MDPDAALANARTLVARLRRAQAQGQDQAVASVAAELADAFDALDDWLSGGGFLPAAWAREAATS